VVVSDIEIGKEFEVAGVFVKSTDGGYGLEKSFNLEVAESSNLGLDSDIMSSCENEGEPTSIFLMESSDRTFKISSKEFEGYTHVAGSGFPGQIAGGKYVFTVLFVADVPCEVVGASFKLKSSVAQPTTTPGPSDTTINTLAGTWKNEELGVYSLVLRLDSSGTGNETLVYEGAKFYDLDYSYTYDTTKSPKQLVQTVTKINYKDSDLEINVGDKNYCIYVELSATALKMECDEVMPTVFSSEAEEFRRQ